MNALDAPPDAAATEAGAADARPTVSEDAAASDTPAVLAARLVEHHRRRRALFDWMHPQRLAAVPYADCLRGRSARETGALAEAWLAAAGMPAPALALFGAPGAALALLPPAECLSVFRLRALLDRIDEVRAWIDRPRRNLLGEWIGARGVKLLLGPHRALAAGITPLARRAPLTAADGDALAWLGFRLFERECNWTPDGPLALMQLALPALAEYAAPRSLAVMPDGRPSRSIVAQLPNLFPEWSW
ncbi:type III secretion protein HrpB4 [Burkholderia sp. Ax-1724]|uniref:type III secretion protein HrpB4 n=1 Tax=Burkholderia sp. Ax-1724 TaxID=2608336 RepID=UPI0014205B44|nr:type III secretion protein HrpB4 [Burkholderia sp. Ax-1724]NIF54059.1 hypothetical protein [Burkholderia sp. Ax-1724]